MALFRSNSWSETLPTVGGGKVYLRIPEMSDWAEWARLREQSRTFLTPWEPIWPADDLTKTAFRRRLRRYQHDLQADVNYPFFIFRSEDQRLVGGVSLTNVRRGIAQAVSVGYWIGEPFAHQGYMSAAMRALVPFTHVSLRLRRIEAACLPENAASIGLLQRLGFRQEGCAREYLCIAGKWQDHLLFAHLADDPLH
jgi:ribosomal-protein-alanine N-acetyltransferase